MLDIHHLKVQLVRLAMGGGAALEAKSRLGLALRVGAPITHPALALDEEARHAAAQASHNRGIPKSQLLEGLKRLGCDAELLCPDAVLSTMGCS